MVCSATYLTTTQAGKVLGVTPKHVVWLIHHGHLDGKKWLRMWMVERKSVQEWKKHRRTH